MRFNAETAPGSYLPRTSRYATESRSPVWVWYSESFPRGPGGTIPAEASRGIAFPERRRNAPPAAAFRIVLRSNRLRCIGSPVARGDVPGRMAVAIIPVSRASPGEGGRTPGAGLAGTPDVFRAARRRLEDYERRHSGRVKAHEPTPRGRIARLIPAKGCAFIETPDGREIYFHRNSLLNADFDRLEVGDLVRYHEEAGEMGPQASTVHVERKLQAVH